MYAKTIRILSGALLVCLAPALAAAEGGAGLLARWAFDEGAGRTAADGAGGNPGEVFGAQWRTGVIGTALHFDGVNDRVAVDDPAGLDPTEEISVEAWVLAGEAKTAKVVQKGDWDGHGLGLDKWKGWFGHVRTAAGETHKVNLGERAETDRWVHLALTYDGTALRLYVDGAEAATALLSGSLAVNTRPLSIGSDGGSQKFFSGAIDEVAIYGRALTPAEIETHAAGEPATTSTENTSWGGIKSMFR